MEQVKGRRWHKMDLPELAVTTDQTCNLNDAPNNTTCPGCPMCMQDLTDMYAEMSQER
jgi:hypothetical protein